MPAKSIMITGTMSSAGKSFIAAGLCRIFSRDGYKTAPFKSQNMALNSFITRDGFEMGRAQVMQAEAAGVEPDVRMNPILLKPTSESGSQVIVNGEIYGTMKAADYYKRKTLLIPEIMKAYSSLAEENDIIVLEGAGSPAEINLKSADIVNMGMAEMADSPVLLVGDIDRGGVFASLYGTIALLTNSERARMKGMIINKFRGDVSLLKSGLDDIERLTGIPVLGVVPYINVDIDDEDSLSERLLKNTADKNSVIDIAVIRLPRISNFTDYDVFGRIEGVSLRYVSSYRELGFPDAVIIPGTKSTMSDMKWLRQSGIEAALMKLNEKGTVIFGICGGFQMLGRTISDPYNTEEGGEIHGMGLLDTTTSFELDKRRTRKCGTVSEISGIFKNLSGKSVEGYEIHMGRTFNNGNALPFTVLDDGSADGYRNSSGNVFGTYLHGIFDNCDMAKNFVSALMDAKGIDPKNICGFDSAAYKNSQYDKMADVISRSLDMKKIYSILNKEL